MRYYIYRQPLFRHPLIASALIMAAITPGGFANPYGESVVAGKISFERTPSTLQVTTTSDRAVVNWQGFSIGTGETTRFVQPSASSVVLNRVVSGDPSSIYGNLEANGRIYLINPNGVLVGATGRVDTAGFLASTLDVANSQFLTGSDLVFSGTSAASVVNRGTIHALGGDIFLFGASVENSGTLSARSSAGLAAGSEILLKQTGDQRVTVRPSPAIAGRVKNSGLVEAVRAELKANGNLYALAINNSGVIRANGSATKGGRVYLTSNSGNIQQSGTIASRAGDNGGSVVLRGGQGSRVTVSGRIEANGSTGTGGDVRVLGKQVALTGSATLDVSGRLGGGTALIGGDVHGANAEVPNATNTFVGQEVRINASAIDSGNGGKVVVWANDTTGFQGAINARGGTFGGNGGFVEVSGKRSLAFSGKVNLLAAKGTKGSLLLDPDTIDIVEGEVGSADDDAQLVPDQRILANDNPSGMTISWGQIDDLGASANVLLEAKGNINLNVGSVALGFTDGSVTFHSTAGDIGFQDIAGTLQTEGGGLNFRADKGSLNLGNLNTTGASGSETGAGAGVILTASNSIAVASITTYGAPISITSTNSTVTTGGLSTSGLAGNITLKSGSVLTTGALVTSGTVCFTSAGGANFTDNANNFAAISGTNAGSDLVITDAATTLNVGRISQTGGNLNVQNSGNLNVTGTLSNATGDINAAVDGGTFHLASSGKLASAKNISVIGSGSSRLLIDADVLRPTTTPQMAASGNILLQSGPTGTIQFEGALKATGTAQFASPTVFVGDAALTGGVAFNDTLNGAYSLTITSNNSDVVFGDVTGGDTALDRILILLPRHVTLADPFSSGDFSVLNASGTTGINAPLTSSGSVSIISKALNFNVNGANAITTTGSNGTILWNADTLLSGTSTSIVSTGDFTQRGTLSGTNDLSINAGAGQIYFYGSAKNLAMGSIGGYAPLQSISLTAAGINLQPDIRTSGNQTYTATSGTITRTGNGRFISSDGTITFNGPLAANAGLILGVSAPNVAFNGALNMPSGGMSLSADSFTFNTVSAQGAVSLSPYTLANVEIGGAATDDPTVLEIPQDTLNRLGSPTRLTVSTRNGTVTVRDVLTLNYPLTLAASGTGAGVIVNGALTLTGTGALSLQGAVNEINANLHTNAGALFLNAATIGTDAQISSNSGAITFSSSVNDVNEGHLLTVSSTSGNIQFKGAIGAIKPLGLSLATSGTTLIQGKSIVSSLQTGTTGSTALYSSITAADGVSFQNAVKLINNITINAGGDVSFGGAVANGTGKRSLAVTSATGAITFASTLGTSGTEGGGPLLSLSLTSTSAGLSQTAAWNVIGTTTLNLGSNNLLLGNTHNNFGLLKITAGNVTINEESNTDFSMVGVTGDVNLNSAGNLAIRGVSSASSPQNITLLSSGTISIPVRLNAASLVTGSTGTTLLGNALTVSGTAAFRNPVQLIGNTTVTAGGTVRFADAVSSGASAYKLTVKSTAGDITFASTLNLNGALSLSTANAIRQSAAWNVAGTTTLNIGSNDLLLDNANNNFGLLQVTARNVTIYEASNTDFFMAGVTGDVNLVSTGNIAIKGISSLNTPHNVSLLSSGTISVPVALNAASLVTGSTGLTLLGNALTLSGSAAFGNPVQLVGNTTITAGDSVRFADAVSSGTGAYNLTVKSTASDIAFESTLKLNAALSLTTPGAIGQSAAWTVGGATSLNGGSINLSESGNSFAALQTVTAPNSIIIRNSVGNLTVTGAAALSASTGKIVLYNEGGDLILAGKSATRVNAPNTVLAASGQFLNYAGSRAVSGQFSIFSASQAASNRGGLVGYISVGTPVPSFEEAVQITPESFIFNFAE